MDGPGDPACRGPIPRVAKGVRDRVSRIRALGNGQVPAVVDVAWRVLVERAVMALDAREGA